MANNAAGAFSMQCPGCLQDLDVPEGADTLPVHRRGDDKTFPAYAIGARFPALPIGSVWIDRPCKWSGALILERRIP